MQGGVPRAQRAAPLILPNGKLPLDDLEVENKDGGPASRGRFKLTALQIILAKRLKRLLLKISHLPQQQSVRLSVHNEQLHNDANPHHDA